MSKEIKTNEMNINEIKEALSKVLSDFMQAEMGNKITPFNMQGLASVLTSVLSSKEE